MGHKRRVMSQVSSESLGWAAKWGSLASSRKNSWASDSIVKAGLFGEIYTPLMGAASQKVRAALGDSHSIDRVPSVSKSESGTEVCGWLVFRGWVLSLAREWEEYSNYLGEGAGISRSWASPAFGPFMASNLPAYARDAGVMHSRKQTHSEGQCR